MLMPLSFKGKFDYKISVTSLNLLFRLYTSYIKILLKIKIFAVLLNVTKPNYIFDHPVRLFNHIN